MVSISWIPSSAVTGLTSLARDAGVAHYDTPPPGVLADLEALRIADGFRFANDLRAWIEVDDGRIVGWGHQGHGHIGSTTLRLGSRNLTFAAVPLPICSRNRRCPRHQCGSCRRPEAGPASPPPGA